MRRESGVGLASLTLDASTVFNLLELGRNSRSFGFPKNVGTYYDRHGRLRMRFRRIGWRPYNFVNTDIRCAGFWMEFALCYQNIEIGAGQARRRLIGVDRVLSIMPLLAKALVRQV